MISWPSFLPSWVIHSFILASFLSPSLTGSEQGCSRECSVPWVWWYACTRVIHMHSTKSWYFIYRLFIFYFFLLSWSRECGGGSVTSPSFCFGHSGSGGTLFIPLGVCFKAPREEAAGQGVSPGPLRAWPRGVQLAGGNSVLCFAADAGGGEEWQLCWLNLCGPRSSVSPLAPSFEPMVPEIDLFIMIVF